jgi:hypothetical protein
LKDKKILSGVLTTAFAMTMIFAVMPNAHAKNNLLSGQDQASAAHKAALLLSVPSTSRLLEKYENATSLTDSQLVELLKAVGFKGKSLKTAWAVAKAESNGRPFAFNGNTKTGDSSYGIFQINMLGTLGPDRRDKFNLDLNAELFSPVKNAQAVYHMTDGGLDWSSWPSYTKGAYKKWLNKFPG